ncbi:GNAT family N-acetyltransferase [Virgibacillus soli]|uniref:GNAT family N-acetyltransferase n=1 Tax=Paracerasibacillus soli TaxID=480284 RepID=A0ABU5CPN4_9BACI|nr:GNAT family N-acetyltransferase [Virgibacillus soli]MDY0407846.1 GNAT family N-acetyltransferase [Virgibacillus soli]
MEVRKVRTSDVDKLAQLMNRVDESSQYMLWEPGERNVQAEDLLKMIQSMQSSGNATVFVAEKNKELAGYLFAKGGSARRNKHVVYIVIGILKEYRGQGIGSKLFSTLEQWAFKNGFTRLELTVVKKNEPAIALYKKAGFEIEGTKRKSLQIDGEFIDEYYMSKIMRGS